MFDMWLWKMKHQHRVAVSTIPDPGATMQHLLKKASFFAFLACRRAKKLSQECPNMYIFVYHPNNEFTVYHKGALYSERGSLTWGLVRSELRRKTKELLNAENH